MAKANYHQLGNKGYFYRATVEPTKGFSASADAEKLHYAMKGLGTDEKAVISVLGRRTNAERQEILQSYQTYYKKSLINDIIDETSGDFRVLLKLLLRDTSYVKAEALYYAMKGIGTQERVINEILLSCTNAEIAAVKAAYLRVLEDKGESVDGCSLIDNIKKETSGNYKSALCSLLDGQRDELSEAQLKLALSKGTADLVNVQQAKLDAKTIFEAGQGRLGTQEKRITSVFAHRLPWQVDACAKFYPEIGGMSLMEAIVKETSGDYEDLLVDAINYSCDRAIFYAKKIRWCVEGPGTKDYTLMRLIACHSEIELQDIKEAYEMSYGEKWEAMLTGDTSGDYHKLLAALSASN